MRIPYQGQVGHRVPALPQSIRIRERIMGDPIKWNNFENSTPHTSLISSYYSPSSLAIEDDLSPFFLPFFGILIYFTKLY